MHSGTENKNKVWAAIGLGILAVIVIAYEFMGSSSTPVASTTSAASTSPQRPTQRRSKSGKQVLTVEPRLDPTLDLTALAATEQVKYSGNGRNIFVASVEIPKPTASAVTDQPAQPSGPPTPPPPPPITLRFFGFASGPGEPKRIFLSQGEDVFIAAEGDIVNRRYKVLHIGTNSVDIEDVLYNNRQSIPLTQG